MNIYLVNNHPTTRTAIKGILESTWSVLEYESGEDFLEAIKNDDQPAVVLLDIDMPAMNGLTVMDYMKRNEKLQEYPVIFITETKDKEIEFKCLKQGASDFISCPFNPEVIFQRVENVVNQHQAYTAMVSEVTRTTHFINDSIEKDDKKVTYQVLTSLSSTIDAKDYYTKGHSTRVAEYSLLIGREIGLPKKELETLYYGALLHDIGKIGVSDVILRKSTSLDPMEYDVIKKHPTIGYNILRTITLMPEIAQCARWHHERYDGNGYPDGLKGTEIPLYARIIGVTDAFDAMTSNRAYRKAMKIECARDELIVNKSLQFDPYIADIMINLIKTGKIKEREAEFNAFCP